MVNYQHRSVLVFSALGHATRRAIMGRLEKGDDVSVSNLAKPLALKLSAMLKHLDVLENARLIKRRKTGRTMYVRAKAPSMAKAMDWLRKYERFWSRSLDRLVAYAEKKQLKARSSRA
jgi:DNA-binding transcriptional ArsR family regulator